MASYSFLLKLNSDLPAEAPYSILLLLYSCSEREKAGSISFNSDFQLSLQKIDCITQENQLSTLIGSYTDEK